MTKPLSKLFTHRRFLTPYFRAGLRGMLKKAREARKKSVDEYQSNHKNKTVTPIEEKAPEERRETEEGREPEESRKPVEQKTKRVPRFFRGKNAKKVEQKKTETPEVKEDSEKVNKHDKNANAEELVVTKVSDDIEKSDAHKEKEDAEKEPVLSPQSMASVNSAVSNESMQSPASSRSSEDEERDTQMVESIQSVDSHLSIIQSPRGAGIRSMPKTPDYVARLEEAEDTPIAHTTGFLCGCI